MINFGICQCGCGRLTRIAIKTDHSTNRIKGKPMKFILGHNLKQHGHSINRNHSPTYSTWHMMIQRCTNPKATKYQQWGGSGITVCKGWMKFKNFLKDMGERTLEQNIHRINSKLGYTKENCIWINKKIHGRLSIL